ncbi:MAG: type II toxin-antitoxin system HigB family toxin [Magnetococcales bacterium]|nr:type II toxin-antitoxin system HigB family toxin [Magnetococcales bacterium]
MRIIALKKLRESWENDPALLPARDPVLAWYRHTLQADWQNPAEVKRDFGSASLLRDNRVVFNIGGNNFRLVVRINYSYRVVYIRFLGTHQQYDQQDVESV